MPLDFWDTIKWTDVHIMTNIKSETKGLIKQFLETMNVTVN